MPPSETWGGVTPVDTVTATAAVPLLPFQLGCLLCCSTASILGGELMVCAAAGRPRLVLATVALACAMQGRGFESPVSVPSDEENCWAARRPSFSGAEMRWQEMRGEDETTLFHAHSGEELLRKS